MMKRWFRLAVLAMLVALPLAAQQEPVAPGRGQTLADTLEVIQQARVVTRVLFIVAHPDDEASTLLTYLPHGLGADTTLLTLNRGEGGQKRHRARTGPATRYPAQRGAFRRHERRRPAPLFHTRGRFRFFENA